MSYANKYRYIPTNYINSSKIISYSKAVQHHTITKSTIGSYMEIRCGDWNLKSF